MSDLGFSNMDSFLGRKVARRYTIDKLLHLRTTLPVVVCAVRQINPSFEHVNIFRLPDEAIRHPDRVRYETKSLTTLSHKSKIPLRRAMQSSDEWEARVKSESSTNLDAPQVQWNLRRRESSDRSSQPYSAPSSVVTQQSENFQRFYRAVVSPTHVRVTAGGRIVPNTRASAPPPYEWNGEKLHFESRQQFKDDQHSAQTLPWPSYNSLAHGFPQLIPAGFLPPQYNNLQGNMIDIQGLTHRSSGSFYSADSKNCANELLIQPNDELTPLPQAIKISPPTQFDQTKPFMYNGQLVYPIPQGFQPSPAALPVPVTMLGNSNFLQHPSQASAAFFSPQLSLPRPGLDNPHAFQQGQTIAMPQVNAIQAPEHTPMVPVYMQMKLHGMLPSPDFIRSQIQGLRGHVSLIENQLPKISNQAEECWLASQRAAMLNQIDTMERGLVQHTNVDNRSSTRNGNSTEESEPETMFGGKMLSPTDNITSTLMPQQPVIVTSELQSKRTKSIGTGLIGTVSKHDVGRSRSMSRLSAAAAMAPPFQPRTQGAGSQGGFKGLAYPPPTEPASARSQPQHGPRQPASLSKAHSLHFPSTSTKESSQLASFQRCNTFHGQTGTLAAMLKSPSVVSQSAIPYLVGTLPVGVSAATATAGDLIYSRDLTEEEVRARYLYWGKAPRYVQVGLPKFDGKDFYPPSPVKNSTRLAHSETYRSPTRMPLPDFENLFTEAGVPGYKSPPTIRSMIYPQPLVVSPEKIANNDTNRLPQTQYSPSHIIGASPNDELSNQTNYQDLASYRPMTPPRATTNDSVTEEQDFSSLFLERGVPGYKSPTPPQDHHDANNHVGRTIKVTPAAKGNVSDAGEGYWTSPRRVTQLITQNSDHISPGGTGHSETHSDSSTVEIRLTPHSSSSLKQKANLSDGETTFAERVANFNSEQQTLFLQNMLRNTATMSAPALSNGVTSATAQGYLPQYRGSAAASLSPAFLNVASSEREAIGSSAKNEQSRDINASVGRTSTATLLSENRPFNHDPPTLHPVPSSMDAEAYMRFVQKRAEEELPLLGWNHSTTGTGPIMGSDW